MIHVFLSIQTVFTWYDTMYAVLPLCIVILTIVLFVVISHRRGDEGSPKVLLHSGIWATVSTLILFLLGALALSFCLEDTVKNHIIQNIAAEDVDILNITDTHSDMTAYVELTVPTAQQLTYLGRDGEVQTIAHTLDRGGIKAEQGNAALADTKIVQMEFQWDTDHKVMVPVYDESAVYPLYILPGSELFEYIQNT